MPVPFLDADAVWSGVAQRLEERVDARARLFDVLHARRIGYAHKALAGLTERGARHNRDLLLFEQPYAEFVG